jgi:DNA-binding NtrC family response regulator
LPISNLDTVENRTYDALVRSDVFLIDDEVEICRSLTELLSARGYRCESESEPRKAITTIREREPRVVLLDIRMPDVGGIDLLRSLKEEFPRLPVIMITGHATVDNAIKAMRFGAANFFTKPVPIPELVGEIERLKHSFQDHQSDVNNAGEYVTQDEEMLRILAMADQAASTDATVLITGESGTGKELVANRLHLESPRREGPFVKINCAAIPEDLLESELFGHEAGAFTDARGQKIGLFESAQGGTLFLDEIGEMSPGIQAKMLRVLQDQQFTRLGGTQTITANVRVITATNRTLEDLLEGTGLRRDLYYRISVIHLHLKPLRERAKDILLLAEHFLLHFSVRYKKTPLMFSQEIKEMLKRHSWPGNVRELKNLVERLVIFAEGSTIDWSQLPEQYQLFGPVYEAPGSSEAEGAEQELMELSRKQSRELVLQALNKAGGVRQEAAKLLNVNRKTLYNWMRKLDLL